jgi:hypothetical protein
MQIIRFFLLLAVVVTGIGGLCYIYKIGPFRPLLSRERYLAQRRILNLPVEAVVVDEPQKIQPALMHFASWWRWG